MIIVSTTRTHPIGAQLDSMFILVQVQFRPEVHAQPCVIVREATYEEWFACCVELGCDVQHLPTKQDDIQLGVHYYEIRTD